MFISLMSNTIYAQVAALSCGGDAIDTGGSISFSIGQPFFETFWDTDISIAAGVQQAYEVSETSDTRNPERASQISVCPNPTTDIVKVNVCAEESAIWRCTVLDGNGRIIREHQSRDEELLLNFRALPAGTYMLRISDENQYLKTFVKA
jgi:hypothetical protein